MESRISTTCKMISQLAVVNGMTAHRAEVIAYRTNSEELGIAKALMIENLKTKMANGVAHFVFVKKDGSLREAWGTIQSNLAKAKTNGRGVSRENFATCAFWDVCKGEWASFRWETLVAVF